ncbi:hypothetical protein GCM10010172_18800 [Paractinoplanes ferrugineus]|uniref:Uncharacterized protein n=1 Tax=Paractinoplanes ferrugineus TaxID=113564 RepID=A0A919J8W2_9ACTN|nr:hypothetical protein [Actinoplanes ferrugineus]GIE14829.1 hypothetical protein Afe05nite_66690 [Actinoplanes ferrugineus]
MTPAHSDHPVVPGRPTSSGPGRYRRVAYVQFDDRDGYEPDWSTSRHRRRRRSGRTGLVLLAMSAVAVTAGAIFAVSGGAQPATVPVAVDAALQRPAAAASEFSTSAAPAAPAAPAKSKVRTPSSKASSRTTRPPRPVSGLNQTQMNNAAVIVRVAQDRGLPRQAMLVAMMTGLQESGLRNLANPKVPDSLDRPHEGSGDNFDSLGVFQQRPSQGWGSVPQLMNPRYAADAFYERLLKVSDWESRTPGDAAQAVQRSAVPDAYAEHENRAVKVLDALL